MVGVKQNIFMFTTIPLGKQLDADGRLKPYISTQVNSPLKRALQDRY